MKRTVACFALFALCCSLATANKILAGQQQPPGKGTGKGKGGKGNQDPRAVNSFNIATSSSDATGFDAAGVVNPVGPYGQQGYGRQEACPLWKDWETSQCFWPTQDFSTLPASCQNLPHKQHRNISAALANFLKSKETEMQNHIATVFKNRGASNACGMCARKLRCRVRNTTEDESFENGFGKHGPGMCKPQEKQYVQDTACDVSAPCRLTPVDGACPGPMGPNAHNMGKGHGKGKGKGKGHGKGKHGGPIGAMPFGKKPHGRNRRNANWQHNGGQAQQQDWEGRHQQGGWQQGQQGFTGQWQHNANQWPSQQQNQFKNKGNKEQAQFAYAQNSGGNNFVPQQQQQFWHTSDSQLGQGFDHSISRILPAVMTSPYNPYAQQQAVLIGRGISNTYQQGFPVPAIAPMPRPRPAIPVPMPWGFGHAGAGGESSSESESGSYEENEEKRGFGGGFNNRNISDVPPEWFCALSSAKDTCLCCCAPYIPDPATQSCVNVADDDGDEEDSADSAEDNEAQANHFFQPPNGRIMAPVDAAQPAWNWNQASWNWAVPQPNEDDHGEVEGVEGGETAEESEQESGDYEK